MQAAWLEAVGAPLEIKEVSDPVAAPAGVVVRVLAVRASAFALADIDKAIAAAKSLGGLDYALLLPNG